MINYTLVLWEAVPESVDLYLVPNENVEPNVLKIIHGANDQYINFSEDCDCVEILNHMLSSNYPPNEEEIRELRVWDSNWIGCLQDFKVSADIMKLSEPKTITHIVRTGFIM